MKINPDVMKVYRTYDSRVDLKKENKAAYRGSTSSLENDRLDISQQARELAKYRQELDRLPDVRTELLAKIKSRIQGGDYQPAPDRIAAGIIKEKLLDEKV